MNLNQVKKDLDNGVLLSRSTVHKVVEAALQLQEAMQEIEKSGDDALVISDRAWRCLSAVEAL